MFTCAIMLLALFASVQGRAVNISNTWVLPEEGFPVFYRYFRDRISWYEADAVCQFHHANLVTVDTTAQYDAVRAYLKELDISSAVWVGLIRSNPDGDFTWTDYRGLSGEGYWSAAPDARAAPLCAAADPAADYRWEARACGGPTVASFICELPVPQWALGNEGCMVRALPALTILYLPESAAVQLTADCGLAGVKKVQCTGNVKRENLLKNLSCNEEDDLSTFNPLSGGSSTWTSSDFAFNITNDLEVISELSTEQEITTEHTSETDEATTTQVSTVDLQKHQSEISKVKNNYIHKNILDLMHNNNLQSNDIPKLAGNENFLTLEQSEKLEDEKLIHHKMLHDELARHGNFETIFTQPTDHFVPPLVMAKAKISDDMTVLSLAEKHAQQLAEQQRFIKHNSLIIEHSLRDVKKNIEESTTEQPHKIEIVDKPLIMTFESVNAKNTLKKDKIKTSLPKKYKEKYDDPKAKNIKLDGKLAKFEKLTEKSTTLSDITTRVTESTATTTEVIGDIKNKEDPIELTVILKEPETLKPVTTHNLIPETTTHTIVTTTETISTVTPEITKHTSDFVTTEKEKSTDTSEKATTLSQTENVSTEKIATDILNKSKVEALKDIIDLNHEIIKITIVSDDDKLSPTQTVYVLTTSTPELKGTEKSNDKLNNEQTSTSATSTDITINNNTGNPSVTTSTPNEKTATSIAETVNVSDSITTKADNTSYTTVITTQTEAVSITASTLKNQMNETKNASTQNTSPLTTTPDPAIDDKTEMYNISEIYDGDSERNETEAIDDLNSPLLSGANEPAHRPNRSRRPKTPPSRLNKFNPFRILG